MASNLRSLVPLAYVADVERSVAFYTTLGFEVGNLHTPDDARRATWAALELREARIMLAQASEPVVPDQQAVLSTCTTTTSAPSTRDWPRPASRRARWTIRSIARRASSASSIPTATC